MKGETIVFFHQTLKTSEELKYHYILLNWNKSIFISVIKHIIFYEFKQKSLLLKRVAMFDASQKPFEFIYPSAERSFQMTEWQNFSKK